jgi:DNA-binding ferritin-like protein
MLLRAMQLFAHAAHNMASGPTFFADHAHLGGLYEAYEEAYDGVVERMIGLGEKPDLCDINKKAAELAGKCGDCCPQQKAFETLVEMEAEMREKCREDQKGQSIGTVNFLQGLADASEQRSYLLGQRVKK